MTKNAGRPRSLEADGAILAASGRMFFQQAFNDVSMQSIALEAGVSKATLYRRWPNKYSLAVAVLMQAVDQQKRSFEVKDYKQHLTENLKALRDLLAGSFADVIMALIAQSQQDEKLREEFVVSFLLPVQAIGDADLKEAISLGQIQAETDKDLLFDQMFGFFFYRLLVIQREVTDQDIDTIVASFMQVAKA